MNGITTNVKTMPFPGLTVSIHPGQRQGKRIRGGGRSSLACQETFFSILILDNGK